MTLLRLFALAALAASCRSAPAPAGRSALADTFTAQLARSAADWNRGALDGFMADYAREAATGFVAEGRVQRGYDFIRGRYAPLFAEGARRDSLRFENVEARPLGIDFALVTARYVLFRDGATVSSGPFTLVMQRRPDGWKILHDHTSSDPR
ncbi:MAG TPA: nuclear transport factor 2 family protein [Gemmatimonadales bacterium]|nr:nuclear transport factor 2 family protein [Gemmatimonadales bacterium]